MVDQNRADSTFGFGVVFSDRALEFLRADDPHTFDLVTPFIETWENLTLAHRGTRVVIDGIGFAGIDRLKLLELLRERALSVGIVPEYERTLSTRAELDGYDLVVGADGKNSFVRRTFAESLGATEGYLHNKFIWYGTTKRFDTLTQTFIDTAEGPINVHHHPYSAGMSTFLVECDPVTWERLFAGMDDAKTRAYLEQLFVVTLGGHALISNNSVWRTFPKIRSARWSTPFGENSHAVIIGDALHTTHYSIGSGTRLAMEDAIALARAIGENPGDLPESLAVFEAARRPLVEKLVAAADASADWYEHYPEHMKLEPWDFAWSYIQRSGRINVERLRKISPKFVTGYETERGAR